MFSLASAVSAHRFPPSVALIALSLLLATCSTGSPPAGSRASGKLDVVAAENVWGSIARQLGGATADVHSLIDNPNTDPHDYEPTPGDARAIASARLVIVNGIGYDAWADKLLAANRSAGRAVLRVGDIVGLKAGANPHQWYSPTAVEKVITAVTEELKKLDPAHGAGYETERDNLEAAGLAAYHSAIADIRTRYAGAPIGGSESLVVPLATALGLELTTPAAFLDAISEGSDPTAADKTTVDHQIATKAIRVFVFNRQNATPDVQRLVDAAKANGIPVVPVTETLTPAGATFQDWQTGQLRALGAAIASAAGR